MHTLGDGPDLLELLREAGDEAVTLDELEVVGIADPARALLELELAGARVQRVYEHESRAVCVRLAPEGAPEIDILGNELVEPPEFEVRASAAAVAAPALEPEPAAPLTAEPEPAGPVVAAAAPEPSSLASSSAGALSASPRPRGALFALLAALVLLLLASRR